MRSPSQYVISSGCDSKKETPGENSRILTKSASRIDSHSIIWPTLRDGYLTRNPRCARVMDLRDGIVTSPYGGQQVTLRPAAYQFQNTKENPRTVHLRSISRDFSRIGLDASGRWGRYLTCQSGNVSCCKRAGLRVRPFYILVSSIFWIRVRSRTKSERHVRYADGLRQAQRKPHEVDLFGSKPPEHRFELANEDVLHLRSA